MNKLPTVENILYFSDDIIVKIGEPIEFKKRRFMQRNEDIQLHLESVDHLFESRVLNPLKNREMQGSGMDVVYTKVRIYSPKIPPNLILILPPGDHDKMEIENAIKKFCDLKIQQARSEHQIQKRERYFGLITGFFVMTLCLIISYLIMLNAGYSEFIKFYLKEGLFIVGWVSMWRPTEILIFDWWPYRQVIKTYNYIKTMPVAINLEQ